VTRLLIAAYLVEAGLVLMVGPWTGLWDRNYFAQAWPWLGALMSNPYLRGAVTGIGVITVASGVRDLVSALSARGAASAPSVTGPPS
jgi:hypothetical protein